MKISSNGEIASRIFIEGRNITKFPLDINEAVNKLKLDKPTQIEYCNMPPEISAYTHRWEFGRCIFINKNHSIQRQRFSACHEIGHLYFGHKGLVPHAWNYTDTALDIEDAEADDFAAGLLMPAEKLYILASICRNNIPLLLHKTQVGFGVSLSAAAQRITSLALFNGAITLKDRYRTYFCYVSPEFRDGTSSERYYKRLPSGKILNIYVTETYTHLVKASATY